MTIRNLDALFAPSSVAVVGASNRPGSVGAVVIRNLLRGGFAGPILPVNPKHKAVAGVLAYPRVSDLPVDPELAVLCTPPHTVPELVGALAKRGTRACIVLTAGMSQAAEGSSLTQQMLDAARPHCMRILGPNCVGLLSRKANLNASFAHTDALPGDLAFLSQSGAMCTAVLDWARSKGIGFSHFVSLGDTADVDFGDLLDWLGSDPDTRGILLYIESVKHARKFMSAARAAARNKPVIVVKSGRVAEGMRAATSHTGALAGSDAVYDAAFRRAGMLRVFETEELFEAVETLARARKPHGDRLAILTNGGGPGVMATDSLISGGGNLAALAPATLAALDQVLPATWSRGNPVDVIGDAGAERYEQSLRILLQDPGVDAALALFVPVAVASPTEVARRIIQAAQDTRKNVLTSWLGSEAAQESRRLFHGAGIPSYDTPGSAVRAFLQVVHHAHNQRLLLETPPAAPAGFSPQLQDARAVVAVALADGRRMLNEVEAKDLLAAYGIPIVETRLARDAADAATVASELGFPVALKLFSPQVSHKSDVGGVVLDLETSLAVGDAAKAMAARLAHLQPQAELLGFSVQRMARRPGAHEVIVGAATDPIFGPVVLFGHGGTAVEVIGDRAVAMPPLNLSLARHLIERTRIHRLLAGYRNVPPADLEALQLTLVRISQLLIEVPEIVELDVNPLLVDDRGVLALDARVRIEPVEDGRRGEDRLAIRPYPEHLEEWCELDGRRVVLRPIRPEDEAAHRVLFDGLTAEDVRFRFFGSVRQFPHTEMARFTQIDYDREMAFIAATHQGDAAVPETLGVVRGVTDPNNEACEFAIVVRSDMKEKGLGRALLAKLVRYATDRGTERLEGEVMRGNRAMLGLAESVGFRIKDDGDGDAVHVELPLHPPGEEDSNSRGQDPGHACF